MCGSGGILLTSHQHSAGVFPTSKLSRSGLQEEEGGGCSVDYHYRERQQIYIQYTATVFLYIFGGLECVQDAAQLSQDAAQLSRMRRSSVRMRSSSVGCGAAQFRMRRSSARMRRSSVGSASACCKAGPSSNLGSASHWGSHC